MAATEKGLTLTDHDWDDFVRWARTVADAVDLDREEHGYKRAMAARLGAARRLFLENDEGWYESLLSALQSTNLLHWRTVSRFREAASERPEALAAAIGVLWGDVDAGADDLAAFEEPIREAVDSITPGNIVALGALLLMARDPEAFPPYRTTPVEKWRKLVGRESLGTSPVERYRELLELTDELLQRAPGAGIALSSRLEAQGLGWSVVKWPVAELPIPEEDKHAFARWRGDAEPAGVVPRGEGPAPAMEAAAWKVLGAGLRREPSPVSGSASVWTAATAADLRERISHDPGTGGFFDKLMVQLDGASDDTVLLAAELVYLQCAPQADLRADTKIARVERVLAAAGTTYALPDELRVGLEARGAFGGGQGYNAQIAKHIDWLTKFILEWTDAEPTERLAALRTPDAFAAIAARVASDSVVSVEHAINYLAWPGHFSPVVAASHRRLIRDTFAGEIGGPSGNRPLDITVDLRRIRQAHEKAAPGYPEWYNTPYVEAWRATGPRAWLVRPSSGQTALVTQWLTNGFVSVKAEHLRGVEARASRQAVQVAVEEGYQHLDYAQRETLVAEYLAFLSKMRPEDIVATVADGHLYAGVVAGEPTFVDDPTSRLRREVEWAGALVDTDELSPPLSSLLDKDGSVVDITSALGVLEDYLAAGGTEHSKVTPDVRASVPDLPAVTDDVAGGLHMERDKLQEIVDLLQARQQIVFYGPPGTGKTYVAQQLARHLVGPDDPSRARIVQFHPSYAYEDFFEGYRPDVTPAGVATFALRPGPLRQLASEASRPENQGVPFVLIIDEMNRANLAKVFGELYFLLEYRNESIRLQYNPTEAFSLPPNLFIIGTMNTADRSIAMVDAAIRRRFAFVEMHPGEPPVRGVLDRYITANDLDDERAVLLNELNAAIGAEDRDLQIGPSYLMRRDVSMPGGLERVWKYDLLPLLEEHYYGRLERAEVHERFGLDALRRRTSPSRYTDHVGAGSEGADGEGTVHPESS